MTRLLGILPCVCTTSVRPSFPSNFSSASTAESSPPSALSTRAAGPSSAPPPAKIPIPSASQANASGGSSEIENSTADPSPPTSRITVFLQLFPHAHREGSLVRQFHRGDVLDRDALRLEQRDLLRRRAPRRRANHDLTEFEHALPRQRPGLGGDEIAAFAPGLLQIIDGHAVAAFHRAAVKLTPVRPVRSDRVDMH